MDKLKQSWYSKNTGLHLTRTLELEINCLLLNDDPAYENKLSIGNGVIHPIPERTNTNDWTLITGYTIGSGVSTGGSRGQS